MLKVDLHSHTSDDPIDRIPYSSRELIDRAAALGYDALAITLHDRQLDIALLAPYAAERGVTLIPGIERTIEGRHVLLLNFQAAAEDVRSFDDLARLRQREAGLVVAPHPYFPAAQSLFGRLTRHADLFDAVEYNAMYTASLNFNLPAVRWARRHGKPMVGNGDVHRFAQLGTTYSLVEAAADAASICHAIRTGRVRVETRPLTWPTAVRVVGGMAIDTLGITPRRTPEPVRASL
ncbi:MAG: PHP domain-containing protein [Acidobacteria bacterium]|nr:PHP domain-containing protein [Acidobacteriota bacterium]